RRAALLAWAERRDAVVLEDDYDAEFRYDQPPVGALQGLAPERVAFLGSASKTLAPAPRLRRAVPPAGPPPPPRDHPSPGRPSAPRAARARRLPGARRARPPPPPPAPALSAAPRRARGCARRRAPPPRARGRGSGDVRGGEAPGRLRRGGRARLGPRAADRA